MGIFYWLAKACRNVREAGEVRLSDVARVAGKDPSAVYRFESGDTTPRDIVDLVDAYAEACGLGEPHVIWIDALNLWGVEKGLPRVQISESARSADAERLYAKLEAIETLIRENLPRHSPTMRLRSTQSL